MSNISGLNALMKWVKNGFQKKAHAEIMRNDERYRNNRISPNVDLGNAVLQGGCVIKSSVIFRGNITIGMRSTIGEDCILHGGIIQMGNYCQTGPRVGIYAVNHPMHRVTTYINKELFEGRLKNGIPSKTTTIGHDVWVGYGAILLPGVKIGNGAIIGAGAVVSKDVGSYEVVVGNPARVVKKRFDRELIELLNRWKWWDLTPDELKEHEEFFFEDLVSNPEKAKAYLKKRVG